MEGVTHRAHPINWVKKLMQTNAAVSGRPPEPTFSTTNAVAQ